MSSTVPATARAAILTALNQPLTIDSNHPVKQPSELAPGECLVKIEYAGCCHSDVHIKRGDWARTAPLPVILGHEGVGTVVAIGEHTANTQIKVGDRVGIKWIATTCLSCDLCRRGYESCCPVMFVKSHGFIIDGAFADYVVSYVDYVTPIPEGLDGATAAPILCAGLTIYKALKESKATIGQWVAISGAGGGLGHLGIQYARSMGLRVLAIDTGEEKRKLCLDLGAEAWVDFKETDDLIKAVQKATDGGPHAAVIAVGDAKPFNQALMYLRSAGTLVAVGMAGLSSSLNVPITLLIAKNLNIVGSSLGNRQDVIEALEIAARGKVKPHVQLKKLEDLNDVLKDLEAGKIAGRVVLKL